jgi:hypothetical protein
MLSPILPLAARPNIFLKRQSSAAQMAGVLAAHHVGEGAAVGLCLDENGQMYLGVNSNQVRGAPHMLCPASCRRPIAAPTTSSRPGTRE